MHQRQRKIYKNLVTHIRLMLPYSLIVIYTVSMQCIAEQGIAQTDYIVFHKGMQSLVEALSTEYQDSKGILPDSLAREEALRNIAETKVARREWIYANSQRHHEFFVFTHNKVMVLVSAKGPYFIEFKSSSFYAHFLREFEQIRNLESKSASGVPFLRNLGSSKAEVYFAPEEVSFGTARSQSAYRIRQDTNEKPAPDIWRLIEAAQIAEVSFPKGSIENRQLLRDFARHIGQNKERRVYALEEGSQDNSRENGDSEMNDIEEENDMAEHRESGIANTPVETIGAVEMIESPSHIYTRPTLPFTYIWGKQLQIETDAPLLHGEDIESLSLAKRRQITEDFLAIFSINMGNPHSDYSPLNHEHASMVLIRGGSNAIQTHLNQLLEWETQMDPETEIQYRHPILVEVGNNVSLSEESSTYNDYVVLYNPNRYAISLGGYYLARDSGCNIDEARWTEFIALPYKLLGAGSYFLVARERSESLATLSDIRWSGSISSRYCIALLQAPKRVRELLDNQVIDAIDFRRLSNGKAYRRIGPCHANTLDKSDILASFSLVEDPGAPKNSKSASCLVD